MGSRPFHVHRRFGLVVVVAAWGFATAHASVCPISTLSCGTQNPSPPALATNCPAIHGSNGGSQSYDWPHGTVSASGSGGTWIGGGSAHAADSLVLVAPGSSGPVAITAILHESCGAFAYGPGAVSGCGLSLSVNGGPAVSASITARATDSDPCGYGCKSLSGDLSLPIIVTPDVSFRLDMTAGATAQGEGSASATGQLGFAGLPPGSVIMSCQGFLSAGPTPVAKRSWGALKIAYR